MKLDYSAIASKWKKIWEETKLYKVTEDPSRPKYYVLDMFPYPSGAGLHVGHPLGYVASDIYARYKRMKGFNVLHPMGYDAFGLPAEQYALDTGVHPAKSTSDNIERYRAQLDNIGFSFDWSRQVRTDDPSYYRWTQWIFLQLYDHYYDKDADKAMPISSLLSRFEKSGSHGINAVASTQVNFDASAWKAMPTNEQEAVLMNYRLAFRKVGYVNWCEALGTVLANDEVKDGLSERGGHPVVQREMMQWSLRVTAYAERLLSGMETIQWSESLKTIQRNWIGRSEGGFIDFKIAGADSLSVKVFTTRPDTIFGCTFLVLAKDHDLVPKLTTTDQQEVVSRFAGQTAPSKTIGQKTTEGVWTGSYGIHPITGEQIPVWIADYVLKDYGTGAIMAVPGDDERDLAFAKAHQLSVVDIIDRQGLSQASIEDKQGVMINSSFLNDMQVEAAISHMLDYLEKNKLGTRQIAYKLRDANFSRQRYWGEPFPIYYDADGLVHEMDESTLPHVLPDLDDFKPSPDGRSPLARLDHWTSPSAGISRETDTMPGYAGSSWYFLRYMDPHNNQAFASTDALAYWQDVDLYVGGVEHAVGHLMYSRFWHKFLYDLGYVPTEEPFKKLVNQGMIQGIVESLLLLKERTDGQAHFISSELAAAREIQKESLSAIPVHISMVSDYGHPDSHLNANGLDMFIKWRPEFADAVFECFDGLFHGPDFGSAVFYTQSEVGKMSKRYHNVVNPDDVIDKYGADCFRMYEMFLGPIEQSKPWDTMGIEGISKFLRKMWSMFYNDQEEWVVTNDPPKETSLKILHATIKKTGEDIERFSFNTAISQFMICVNELRKTDERSVEILKPFVQILSPFAPFITEELWQQLGGKGSVHTSEFPSFDEKWLVNTSITYPVCVNGKKRSEITLPAGTPNKIIETSAKELPEIVKWIEGQTIKKVIIVPEKMVNIVL
jgi:leucyl-tRNA synthetase